MLRSDHFRLPGKRHLIQSQQTWDAVVVDVSETPTERPKKTAALLKCHTLKMQLVVDQLSEKIFRILSERYRNRRKRFGLRVNLIAGLLNYELSLKS